jgi:ATP-dependent helicase/nuclease subunit A
LDFKTDKVRSGDEKVKKYELQLQLYARALGAIYQKPVTHAWLHFLATGDTLEIGLNPAPPMVSEAPAKTLC